MNINIDNAIIIIIIIDIIYISEGGEAEAGQDHGAQRRDGGYVIYIYIYT